MSRLNGGYLQIEVSDMGVGFDPTRLEVTAGIPGGFGLFNIRERLELLGGRLEIQSASGRGTRVVIVAPLRQPPLPGAAVPETIAEEGLVSTQAVAAHPPHPFVRVPTGLVRVLLADDHPVVRKGWPICCANGRRSTWWARLATARRRSPWLARPSPTWS